VTLDDAITRARATLLALLRDSAVITHTPLISDGRGGYVPGTPTAITTSVNVQRTIGAAEQNLADRLGVVSPAVLRFPVGTVITSADEVTVGTQTFAVVSPLENTIDLTLKVLCTELGGDTGDTGAVDHYLQDDQALPLETG